MASTSAEDPRPRTGRRRSKVTVQEGIAGAFDPNSGELAVRHADRGKPSYREDRGSAKFTRSYDTTVADPVPTVDGDGWDFTPFSGATVFWQNDGATHTGLQFTPFVQTDEGNAWVEVDGGAVTVGPNVEAVIEGVGYRRFYLQVTASFGGAVGTTDIYVAGV